jgi:hypothetical protein
MSDRYYSTGMPKKPPAPSDLADKFMLRMPDGMRDRITEAAKTNNRSMNAEIIVRLERSFDPVTADNLMIEDESLSAYIKRTEQTHAMMKDLLGKVSDLQSRLNSVQGARAEGSAKKK